MNILYKNTLSAILTLVLVSCGGEGDAKSNVSSDSDVAPTMVVDIPIGTTDDLVSNTTFEFTNGFELNLILSALDSSAVSHFVNICSDYTEVEKVYTINYDSCRLRTSFTATKQNFTLSLSAAETELIAQVWPIENNATPINLFWSRTDNLDAWEIDINN